MPAISHLVGAAVARIATVPDPPLLPGRDRHPSWSDQRLHRLVRLPPWDAAPALRRVVQTERGRIRAPLPPRRVRRSGPATERVLLVLDPTVPGGSPVRIRGALHVHQLGRATPVELTLEPWSVHRTDLCLQVRRGRLGVHLPRRYYDVAHRVMDELWHLIERAAE